MTSPARLRLGLIGAGGIAQSYAQAFRQCHEAELAAVADIRPDVAERFAAQNGCRAYASLDALVSHPGLQGVVVCTPPALHEEQCVELCCHGLHVLCEKPLTLDSLSARRMIETAAHAGVLFTMASKFRYARDVVRARELITSGLIGEVVLFENCFTARVDMSRRWNADPVVSGGGVLIDNGTHSVDVMRYFLGPLTELRVTEGKRIQALPVEDTVRLHVKSRAGVMGSIDLSWSIQKEQPYYISLYGSEGTLLVGWRESKYRRHADPDWTKFGDGYDKHQAFADQLDNFARAVRREEPLVITPEDALASVEVIEAAYAAMRQTHWQPIGSAAAQQEAAGITP
jgi:predicted dehydrogenase